MSSDINTYLHEVNNCINNICSLADLLTTASKTELKQYIELINESAQNLKDIQKDYKIFKKTGKNSIKFTKVNISLLIDEVIDAYRKELCDIEIKKMHSNIIIYTDRYKLRQIITNIITNCCKYCDEKKSHKFISISIKEINKTISFTITDNGIGMTEDEAKKIGNPFFRAGRNDANGTGLGLCNVIKLAKILNMELKISSKLHIGTSFKFIINKRKSLSN